MRRRPGQVHLTCGALPIYRKFENQQAAKNLPKGQHTTTPTTNANEIQHVNKSTSTRHIKVNPCRPHDRSKEIITKKNFKNQAKL